MTKISNAQNFEDIMLWRALKHVENGFYVDVGANDPITDSVTALFYEEKWSGINIDPVEKYILKYEESRPRDINLCLAVSSEKGYLNLWQCDVAGWSTLDRDVAAKHELEGYAGYWSEVKIDTLTSILDQYKPEVIHFLKVDVEGAEYNVLKSNDWSHYRPWIVLIEATVPNTQISDYNDCEELLINNAYHHVYSDGLNRFYVANEHTELDEFFNFPPNIFDDFISLREKNLQEKTDEHYERMVDAIKNNNAATENIKLKNESIASLEKQNQKLSDEHDIVKREVERLSEIIIEFENDLKTKDEELSLGNKKKEQSISGQKNKLLQKLNMTLEEVESLESNIKSLDAKIIELNSHSHFWWENAQKHEAQLNAIYSSRTWRYATLPRRVINKIKQKADGIKHLIVRFPVKLKFLIKKIVKKILSVIINSQFARKYAMIFLNRFPRLKESVRRKFIHATAVSQHDSSVEVKNSVHSLQVKNVIKNKLRKR